MQDLEILITQVTNPLTDHLSDTDLESIVKVLKKSPQGVHQALKLLAHKIQSPQEKEALNALIVLEHCVDNCDKVFLTELAKFRFLNEIIKLLSPKFLGDQTSKTVKDRCIELLYHWKNNYGEEEEKLNKAYDMLVDQGVIPKDAYYPKREPLRDSYFPCRSQKYSSHNTSIKAHPIVGSSQTNRQKNIFDGSSHDETISRLLRSKNPDDLRRANLLIQEVVSKDEEKLERLSKQKTELESTKNNTKLLDEIVSGFTKSESEPIQIMESERDIMSEIAKTLLNSLSTLNSMATNEEENDSIINEVISACDAAHEVLKLYEKLIKHSSIIVESKDTMSNHDSDLLGLEKESVKEDNVDDQNVLGSCATDLSDLETAWLTPNVSIPDTHNGSRPSLNNVNLIDDIFDGSKQADSGLPNYDSLRGLDITASPIKFGDEPRDRSASERKPGSPTKQTTFPKGTRSVSMKQSKDEILFNELDQLGREMFIEKSKTNVSDLVESIVQNELDHDDEEPLCDLLETTKLGDADPSLSVSKVKKAVDLSSIHINLSDIKPHSNRTPLTLMSDSTSDYEVTLAIHYSGNRPVENIFVFVAVITSMNSSPISNLSLRLGANKGIRVKQLPMSSSNLPGYSSFLPATSVSQVFLVQRHDNQTAFELKYQFSFILEDEDVLESGKSDLYLD